MSEGAAQERRSGSASAVPSTARPGSGRIEPAAADQTRLGIFRFGLILQFCAAGFFGLAPLLAPVDYAHALGLSGDEPYLFRLAGAATLGYAVPAVLGLLRGSWVSLRIPMATTFVFNVSAAVAGLVTIDESGLQPLSVIVAVAGSAFAAIAGYWLWRGGAWDGAASQPLERGFRMTLAGATVAATIVGGSQLLLPRSFASVFGVSAADLIIIRLAGAATLGFAIAGLLSFYENHWPAVRIQTIASIVANIAAVIASAVYIAQGGPSWLGFLLLIAAGGLVLSLTAWAARAER
jgi:preprotein translocase subunit Sec61beta